MIGGAGHGRAVYLRFARPKGLHSPWRLELQAATASRGGDGPGGRAADRVRRGRARRADNTLPVNLMTAVLGGAVLLNVFKEELGSTQDTSFAWFYVGLVAYSVLAAVTYFSGAEAA